MVKYIVSVVLILLGLKYGINYIESDDFQKFADEHHAGWSCYINMIIGEIDVTMSRYEEALHVFYPVLKRCPKTSVAEECSFRIAVSLEALGRRGDAAEAYRKYAETYKGTERARVAIRAADYITGP